MTDTFNKIKELVETRDIRISEHGYDELANDGLTAREIVAGFKNAVLVENYPEYPKGACVLVLQRDSSGNPVHVVWGIPKGNSRPAVLITAYQPDTQRWNETFTERKR